MRTSPRTATGARDDGVESSRLETRSAEMRRRRLGMVLSAGFIAPFVLLDLGLPHGPWIALVGITWAGVLVAAGLFQRDGHRHAANVWALLAVLVSAGATTAKILMNGGSQSLFFGLLFALAPLAALVGPEIPAAAAGTGALSICVGTWIRISEGRSLLDVVYWGTLGTGIATLSLTAAELARRQFARQLELERERRQALEGLASAEVRRLQLERLAEAGRLAAAVSHEVNNPLAAVRANLACLLEDLDLPAAERSEVLKEMVAAVQRIAETIGQLRRVAADPLREKDSPVPSPTRFPR
ncbi:MAG TPA: histidine kinase dimerization/phospho-acceptor domain-containing protein [Anaeromyxobacter sp.]|nr:histidine kinase dimerization/phospho-acceptor domain-containing protein [Anaeromyxobacter sp.]